MAKLLDQARQLMRIRHYSLRTEESYVRWMKEYIIFHGKRHPATLGAAEVTGFLSYLATDRNVAASTQQQATAALIFLYRDLLNIELPWLNHIERAKKTQRLPVVFTKDEAQAVLRHLSGRKWLMASLLYGAGLRLMECLRRRVKDIDFAYRQIIVRDGKGAKDRVTLLPDSPVEPLKHQIARVQAVHEIDLREGFGSVYFPMRSKENIPAQANPSFGSMFSPQASVALIREAARCGGTTPQNRRCKKPSRMLSVPPVSTSMRVAIPSATVSQLTCLKRGMTSGRCKNCSVIKLSARL
jgi:integrase